MSVVSRMSTWQRAGSDNNVLDISSTGTGLFLRPARPTIVSRIGFYIVSAISGGPPVMQINHTLAAGGALTPSGDDVLGVINVPAAVNAPGQGFYVDARDFVRQDGKVGSQILVLPSEALIVEVTTAGTSGLLAGFYEMTEDPFQDVAFFRSADFQNPYEITSPQDTTTLASMTRLDATGLAPL